MRLVKYDPTAFFGSCIYQLTFKSGDTVVYSQQTWINPSNGTRDKFEARDETGALIETHLFDYDGIT